MPAAAQPSSARPLLRSEFGFASGFVSEELPADWRRRGFRHKAEALAAVDAQLTERYGLRYKHGDVRLYLLKRRATQGSTHSRGNVPKDDALPRPHTFVKLSLAMQRLVRECRARLL